METKFCKACEKIKSITDFNKDSSRCGGYKDKCKICIKNKVQIPPFKNKTCRVCNKCNLLKDIENFRYGNRVCNCCLTEKSRLFYEANKEEVLEKIKCYSTKNKASINFRKRRRYSNKIKSDSLFKITHNIKGLIKQIFNNKGLKKDSKTSYIIGQSFEDFKKHIESQFESWMSWENYGNVCETLEYNCSWDLDHIIPISYAETEEEVYLLNHWSNFQPLCSYKNRSIKRDNVYPVTNLELNITIIEDKNILKNG